MDHEEATQTALGSAPFQASVTAKNEASVAAIIFNNVDVRDGGSFTVGPSQPAHTDRQPATDPEKRRKAIETDQQALKAALKMMLGRISGCSANQSHQPPLDQIYTEPCITEGGSGEVSNEHEITALEAAYNRQTRQETPVCLHEIFRSSPGQITRTVLTTGIAGIGKTFIVRKFILDWAEGKAHQDIDFIFSLPFRDLNLKKEETVSLMQLLQRYFPELTFQKHFSEDEIKRFDLHVKVLFIFDGLDECRPPLDFKSSEVWRDVNQPSSLHNLLTNLILGNLLPSALVWITSRPAAANQILRECVHRVTEVRGFDDPQKEKYFEKRIRDQNQASRIISHIKASRSLYIMCYIPVFCWISATVLEAKLDKVENGDLPKNLTEMYTHFLLIETFSKNKKYHGLDEKDPEKILESNTDIILKLGQLAFLQLEKRNLVFYGEDLRESGIDVSEAAVHSGLCTEIFKEEYGLYQKKGIYSFVHLTVQEYLAALFVFYSCVNENRNVLSAEELKPHSDRVQLSELHRSAVDQALESENGHLDLFLRFLLGHSLDSIQTLLAGLLTQTGSRSPVPEPQTGSRSPVPDPQTGSRSPVPDPQRGNSSPVPDPQTGNCSPVPDPQTQIRSRSHGGRHKRKGRNNRVFSFVQRIWPWTRSRSSVPDPQTGSRSPVPDPQTGSRSPVPDPQTGSRSPVPDPQTGSRSPVPDPQPGSRSENLKETVQYIKEKIRKESSAERTINLFHCLSELHDTSLMEEIQNSMRSGTLSDQELEPHQCSALAFVLLMSGEILEEFDLRTYSTSAAGHQRLVPVVETCKKAILSSCDLTEKSCDIVASALKSPNSPLRDLDLSYNNLGDSGVKLLCAALMSPNCKLQRLGLSSCDLKKKSCDIVASALKSPNSPLRDLDLSYNSMGDSGVGLLCAGLESPNCKLQRLGLGWCNLTEACCDVLASVLLSPHSELRALELRDNELQDSGVRALSAGLEDPHCKLQRLGLSGCSVTHRGCDSLASALCSNPSHLRELDLRYNHPGDSGVRALSAAKPDTLTLLVDHGGAKRIKPGPRKYGCRLTLDPTTAHRALSLSDGNRKVTHISGSKEQPYPDDPERFECVPQVVCRESVSERCYWEAEWSQAMRGGVYIAVADRGIGRKGEDCLFGFNKSSWSLGCVSLRYSVRHLKKIAPRHARPFPYRRAGLCDPRAGRGACMYRVGVCVDRPAGTVSFYSVSDSDTLELLYTLHTHFSQHTPLCAGFYVYNSSLSLCQLE